MPPRKIILDSLLITALAAAIFLPFISLAQLQMPAMETPDEVAAKITALMPDAPIMVDIARCESGLQEYNANFMPKFGGTGGNYVGVFQIAVSHQADAQSKGFDIYTTDGNIGYAKEMYDAEGTQPWVVCSKIAPTVAKQAAAVGAAAALTANLQIGMSDPQVLTLQKILNASGFTVAASGPGSPGSETTMFGSLTQAAVQKFQCAQNIACSGSESDTGYGRVGPRTRSALLSVQP